MTAGTGALAAFAEGCLQLADGRPDRAEAAFARAVAQAPSNAVAEFHLGQALGAQAQRANVFRQPSLARRTRQSFERAVQLDPDYLDARQGLIQFYLLAPGVLGGSEERAREQVAEVRRRNPYRGAFAAAQLLQKRKDLAGVAREMDALVAQYPDSVGAWTTLLAALGQQRRWDEAWTAADRMVPALGTAPAAQFIVGRLAAESGQRLDRGEAALQRYLQHRPAGNDPSLAAAHWRLGMIRERQGAREAARASYQAAVGLDPKFAPAREALEKLR
jgi:pentatricopeptide repeat protein